MFFSPVGFVRGGWGASCGPPGWRWRVGPTAPAISGALTGAQRWCWRRGICVDWRGRRGDRLQRVGGAGSGSEVEKLGAGDGGGGQVSSEVWQWKGGKGENGSGWLRMVSNVAILKNAFWGKLSACWILFKETPNQNLSHLW